MFPRHPFSCLCSALKKYALQINWPQHQILKKINKSAEKANKEKVVVPTQRSGSILVAEHEFNP